MVEYNINICFKTNLYIGSGFGFARIIDLISIKDADGIVYIPGSTIKGKLKSACNKIHKTLEGEDSANNCKHNEPESQCIICRLFGTPYAEGKLVFKDAKLSEYDSDRIKLFSRIDRFRIHEQNELKNAVKLSRQRRVSSPHNLFNIETVSKDLAFYGCIYAREELTEDEKCLLKCGLKILTHIGGQKSRGLGRIGSICCTELDLGCRRLMENE